jgi:crotonobetainyl-CoA:carnitine CoA-transferase CaiB-like acyl-CoA transferase
VSERPRCLDLGVGFAPAYATKLIADVGWDVVKVEPAGGDPLRREPSPWGGQSRGLGRSQGGAFAWANQGKRSVSANGDLLRRLVAAADLVVADFSAAARVVSGLPDDAFEAITPRLAVVSITPFGLHGPRAGWAASEIVVQAASGMMFLTGEWDQPPMQLPPHSAQTLGAVAAAGAALAAVRVARRDGGVRRADVSMVEAMTGQTYVAFSRYVHRGEVMRREQRVQQIIRMAPAADTYVYCAPGAARTANMKGIAVLLDQPLLAEERFQTPEGRMDNWEEFVRLFVPPFATKPAKQWFEEAEALDLTFALVQTVDELFSCPQLTARRFFRPQPGPDGHDVLLPGPPFRVEGGPAVSTLAAPATVGMHTDEVLAEWLA